MKQFFKRGLLGLVPAALAALALAISASAGPDGNTSAAGATSPALSLLIGNDDLFSTIDLSTVLDPSGTTPTQHFGPYSSGSPDSGTCGNDWAGAMVASFASREMNPVRHGRHGQFIPCHTFDWH